ncbi:MAG: hypothetical protein KF749_18125 [Bacteroidetes bacterium]|nr:hypothetical protein [Bacteroidota bacterium]MCW5894554.1 hypothetical protein [Bacteroidota bacterium]
MTVKLKAHYDGKVLHPHEHLAIKPGTEVTITVESADAVKGKEYSFLDTALSMDLALPPDFSSRLDDYLYRGSNGDSQ